MSRFAALGDCDGPHRADRRPGRADRPRASLRSMPDLAAGAARKRSRDVFGDRLYVELQRHGLDSERAVEPALIDLAYRRACRWSRPTSPISPPRADYEAHDALLCIAEGALISTAERRRLTPEHRFKTRARNDGAVRRPAGGDRQQRRDRAALRLSPADAQADPAALSPSPAARRSTRRRNCAARPREGLERLIARYGCAPGFTRGRLPPAARIRARRHRQDEVPRLFPHRRRLHQMGEGAGHSGRAGARLGRRLAGRLRADHHRSRSACASACCSSASSTPSACRCRTSTSTSARTGATR